LTGSTALNDITIPRNTLVVLCGPAGCGKSTWAAKHFSPTQVVSSDECRALVFDDPANQSASVHAFDLMYFIIKKRLTLGRLTVADATNLRRAHRYALIQIAKGLYFKTAAIAFNIPIETCLARNADRKRQIPQGALMNQYALLERTLRTIEKEGFDYLHLLGESAQSKTQVKVGSAISRRFRRPSQKP
jgi:protein phosphatase